MALDEAIMIEVLQSITRVETKLDMMRQEETEEEGDDSEMPMNLATQSPMLELEFPPFILGE